MEYLCTIPSPIGTLTAASKGQSISGLWIEGQAHFAKTREKAVSEQKLPIFEQLRTWLTCYFSGKEPGFMPPLMPQGSPFQKSIWQYLRTIPYGKTTTYGALAQQFELDQGKHMSAQAVGGAVGRNPIALLIPCHRVLGKNGSLTGYAGGIAAKRALLQLEGIAIDEEQDQALLRRR
jgi:methylated-DNA-[protein]-cysteine S-methyltransferase